MKTSGKSESLSARWTSPQRKLGSATRHGVTWIAFVSPACLAAALACDSGFGDCSSLRNCESNGKPEGYAGSASAGSGDNSHGGGDSSPSNAGGASSISSGASGSRVPPDGGAEGAGTAGADSNGGAGNTGPEGCEDDGTSPTERSCLVDEKFAVFVAPTGDDEAGDGSRENPFATFGHGMDAAIELGLGHVIACNGEYSGALVVDESRDGLSLHGGFGCPGSEGPWEYDSSKRARLTITGNANVLRIAELVSGVTIEDVSFATPDATTAGKSSVAAFVVGSSNVVLRRVKLASGKGKKGSNGSSDEDSFAGPLELKGNAPSEPAGGPHKVCTCPETGETTIGGKGADGGFPLKEGEAGAPSLGAGQGGTQSDCLGKQGAIGETHSDGDGAEVLGSLDETGWTPEPGVDGQRGGVGQGGGGGATDPNSQKAGSSGGCGGCGGGGGEAGNGGGASIALLVVDSAVELHGCEVVTSDAGAGGTGEAGQSGQFPGGEAGSVPIGACKGGDGGPGGNGSDGGGGAGGISVGILYSGTAPGVSADTTIETGAAGNPGAGGGTDNDGIEGISVEIANADDL
jgi:hypothetical protein